MSFVSKIVVSGVEEDTQKVFESMTFAVETNYKLSNEQLNMLSSGLIDTYDFTIGTHKPVEFESYITNVIFTNLEI